MRYKFLKTEIKLFFIKFKKTITISLDELVKWDKKSKELNNQIKNLQIENSNLKIELEEKVKLTNRLIFIKFELL